jgi:hypothetical protein
VVAVGHETAGATPQEMLQTYRPGLLLSLLVALAGLAITAWPRRRAAKPDVAAPELEREPVV